MTSNADNAESFHEVQHAFLKHMRNPENNPAPCGVEDRRMGIYRDLIYRNIEGLLAKGFPVLRQIIDDQHWHDMVRDYIRHHRARTPLFPKMPTEFLHYLEHERRPAYWDPPFMPELAHYEWAETSVSLDPREIDLHGIDVEGNLLDRVPALNPITLPQTYQYPVHRISAEYQPDHPSEEPTYMLIYRCLNDTVRFLELSVASARLFECLHRNTQKTGRQIIEMIAGEISRPDPAAIIQRGIDIMRNMHDKELILGVVAR